MGELGEKIKGETNEQVGNAKQVIGDATDNASIKTFTGYEGIICGASAVYTAIASLLNEVYGRVLLPVGPVKN